jgi:hypothetical protein
MYDETFNVLKTILSCKKVYHNTVKLGYNQLYGTVNICLL